jgi:hypothetical protein
MPTKVQARKAAKFLVASLKAIKSGDLSPETANATWRLMKFTGYVGGHVSDTPFSTTTPVKEQKMATLKKKTDPASLKGTKAGDVFKSVVVKDAGARLSTKKFGVKGRDGNPLMWGKQACQTPSELEHAQHGVWFKRLMQKQGVPGVILTEWETNYSARWSRRPAGWGSTPACRTTAAEPGRLRAARRGAEGSPRRHREWRVAAVARDVRRGGHHDSVLSGELLPEVDLRPASGRRVQSAVINNVSMNWGTSPGSALQPFNTKDLVSELATPLFNLQGAIEVSNDLLSDSPVNIGSRSWRCSASARSRSWTRSSSTATG